MNNLTIKWYEYKCFHHLFQLGKLTVPILKDLAKTAKVKTTGTKKADLIDAINAHYGL